MRNVNFKVHKWNVILNGLVDTRAAYLYGRGMQLFKQITVIDQTNSLAHFHPEGDPYDSRWEPLAVLRKFLEGLSGELKRVHDGMNDLSCDYDINESTELITNWESAVGIPDDCFPGTGTIEERRTHVLLKLAKMNVQTAEEFVELAIALGFLDVEVIPLQSIAFPPYDVPFLPTSAPASRFIILVTGTDIVPNVPPYDVPFTPSAQNSSVLQCIFDIVKPANCTILFVNKIP